jgi:hypothetical protein
MKKHVAIRALKDQPWLLDSDKLSLLTVFFTTGLRFHYPQEGSL